MSRLILGSQYQAWYAEGKGMFPWSSKERVGSEVDPCSKRQRCTQSRSSPYSPSGPTCLARPSGPARPGLVPLGPRPPGIPAFCRPPPAAPVPPWRPACRARLRLAPAVTACQAQRSCGEGQGEAGGGDGGGSLRSGSWAGGGGASSFFLRPGEGRFPRGPLLLGGRGRLSRGGCGVPNGWDSEGPGSRPARPSGGGARRAGLRPLYQRCLIRASPLESTK